MIDAVKLALDTIAPLMPVADSEYSGTRPLYAVVTLVDDYDDMADDAPMLRHTLVQVDVWQRSERPFDRANEVESALAAAGYTRVRGGGDSGMINGVKWIRISADFDYAQEVA